MKILHLIPTYKPAYVYGGPIISVSNLCETQAKAGHQVAMITTTANGAKELDVEIGKPQMVDGVEVTYHARWTKDHSQFSPGLLMQLWKDCKKYEVVHIHSWWNISVILSVVVCWLRGVKPILSLRGMLSGFSFDNNNASPKKIFHRFLGKPLLQTTRLHFTAEAEKMNSPELGADGFILPNIVNTANGQVFENKKNDVFTLVTLSRLHPVKNIESLFEAIAKLPFDVRIKLIGDGEVEYVDSLKKLASQLNIQNKIEWMGSLYDAEKFACMVSADLFVQPSFTENFANAVIENLSVGTPVLVSEKVGLAQYVLENNLGWTCGTNANSIAKVIEDIFYKKEELINIRKTAPTIIKRDFSPKVVAEKYVDEYKRHLANA
jgi:glycosyltransferase involved in cell wall biosynthesis